MVKQKIKQQAIELEEKMSGEAKDASEEVTLIDTPIPGAVFEKSVDNEYKIEVIKDYHGNVDIFYLPKKDPRYEYRFLANDKRLSQSTGNMLFQGGGWQICDKAHCIRMGIEERFLDPNGHYVLGNELILAFIPKHLYAEKMKAESEKAKSQLDTIERRMKSGFSEGAEIHESMKGIQTQKDLGIE